MPPTLARQFYDQIIMLPEAEAITFIRSMIGSRFEDDIFDCKREPTDPEKNKRRQNLLGIWSRALSGFANAQGGVIIWGLVAEHDPATKIDKVNGEELVQNPALLEADLRKLQVETTDPPLGNVLYQPYEARDKPGGFLVCFIPDGPFKPYRQRSCDEQYYYRWGDSFRVMPRHMLQLLFYPRTSALFQVDATLNWEAVGQQNMAKVWFEISLTNAGTATGKDIFVQVNEDDIRSNEARRYYQGESWQKTGRGFYLAGPLHPKSQSSKAFRLEWNTPMIFSPTGQHENVPNIPYVPTISLAVCAENQEPQRFQIRPTHQDSSVLLHRKWVELGGMPIVEH